MTAYVERRLRQARAEGEDLALRGALGALDATAKWLEEHPTEDPAAYLRGVAERLRRGHQ